MNGTERILNETEQVLNKAESMLEKGMILKRILLHVFFILGPQNRSERFRPIFEGMDPHLTG